MNMEQLKDNNLNSVDLETQGESNVFLLNESKSKFFRILLILFIFFLSAFILTMSIITIIKKSKEITIYSFDFTKYLKINLTKDELSELSQKMSIVYDFFSNVNNNSTYFTPLFNTNNHNSENVNDYISLNKISFMVSSSPNSAYLCKLYLDTWSTQYGSNIIKKSGIRPLITVYWRYSDVFPINATEQKFTNMGDYDKIQSYKINLINVSSYHKKWVLMLTENIKVVPTDVEWFYMMDDDTLPFIDRVLPALSKYKDPHNNMYLIHSPGERITTTHVGNGGAGFILSRKMAETIIPNLTYCNNHLNRKHLNGDIRLDLCSRQITNSMPIFDYGMFHMDPKGFKGDLTGFVEGYIDKFVFKALHHLEKWKFYLFPKIFLRMMEANGLHNVRTVYKPKKGTELDLNFESFSDPKKTFFSQAAHFTHTFAVSGDLFLKRYIIMVEKNNDQFCAILNFGYSFVVFDTKYFEKSNSKLLTEILHYLSGVEQTFEITESLLYHNLSRLLTPANTNIKRFYFKKATQDINGMNSYYQEFCLDSSPETVVKIHVDDNQKVSLVFFNSSYIN